MPGPAVRLVCAAGLEHVTLAVACASCSSQRRHAHDSLILGLVTAGARRIDTTGAMTLVPRGSVFVLAPGQAHACAPAETGTVFHDTSGAKPGGNRDDESDGRCAAKATSGAASGEAPADIADDKPNDTSGNKPNGTTGAQTPACSYLALGIGPAALPPGLSDLGLPSPRLDDPALAEALVRLAEALDAPARLLERQSLLAQCLEMLSAHGDRGSGQRDRGGPGETPGEGGVSWAVREAQRLIEANFEPGMDLSGLAEACGSDLFALHRAFTREVGLPPHAFQTHLRLRRAKELLRAGASLAEAALQSGFCDQAHMTRHFTRSVGLRPAQYARAHRLAGGRPKAT